jgi:hypothetical protein
MRKSTMAILCLTPALFLVLLYLVLGKVLILFWGIPLRSLISIFLSLAGLLATFFANRKGAFGLRVFYPALGIAYTCLFMLEVISVALLHFIDHM